MAIKKINISMAGATNAFATIAPFKYNKVGNVALTFDDGSSGINKALTMSENLYYTDGCNNQIKYSFAIAINGDGYSSGTQIYNPNYWQKPAVDAILAKGCDIENHGQFHGGNAIDDVTNLHNLILSNIGYKMGFLVVPSAELGYMHAASLLDYTGGTSQNGDTFDEFAGTHKLYPPPSNPYRFLAIVRDFGDNWTVGGEHLEFIKSEISSILTGQRKFEMCGTHSTLDNIADYNGFSNLLNHIYNTMQDKVLVCTMREILEYRKMQLMPLSQSFSNGVLTVEIDVQDPNQNLRWMDVSLNVQSDSNISAVSGEGFDKYSFNAGTGLVNGFSRRLDFTNVSPEVPPIFDMIKRLRNFH